MAGLFKRAVSAIGFGSSQFNGSSLNGPELESPFKSSQSYLNTKVKSHKKRKSLEENDGSGKKKKRKHRHSIDDDGEFEGFGEIDINKEAYDSVLNSPLAFNSAHGGEDVENSSPGSKNSTGGSLRKKQKASQKDSELADGVNWESISHTPIVITSTAIPSSNLLESQLSKRAKKNLKRRMRRSSLGSSSQINGAGLQKVNRLIFGNAINAATSSPFVLNGVTAESATKSKRKKNKERRLSSDSDVNPTGAQVRNEEVDTNIAAPTSVVTVQPKKKKKKRKRSSLILESDMPTELFVDHLRDPTDGHAEIVEPTDESVQQDLIASPAVMQKQKRKHVKTKASEEQIENLEGPFQDQETSPRRPEKPEQLKRLRKALYTRASSDLYALQSGDSEFAVRNHDGADFTDCLNGLSEPRRGIELPSHKYINRTEHIHSPDEQDVKIVASQSKSKESKRKPAASTAIDQAEADTHIESPLIESEFRKPSKPKARKLESSKKVSATSGEASDVDSNAISSKSKKSKSRNRENAFRESFGQAEDDPDDCLPHHSLLVDSAQSSPPPSWQAINIKHLSSTPIRSIGVYYTNDSETNSLRKSQRHFSENEQLVKSSEASPASSGANSPNSDLGEQPATQRPILGLKRKRTIKTNDGKPNPEALRLPAKKRRTRKAAGESVEEREMNPEALRLPEKKRSKKAPVEKEKKSADLAPAVSTSNGTVKLRGPFSNQEIETMKIVLDNHAEANDMTEHAVREILHSNARTNTKTSILLKELYEALPNRPPESVVKVSRRKFHNFPRYGKWTLEEDEELGVAVNKYSNSWVKVAAELDRHPEDVRDRWRNVVVCGSKLDKGPWTKDEEEYMLEKIEKRLENLRNAWTPEQYEKELEKGRTEYEMLDWALISKDMGGARSRLQCQQKYKQITDRKIPGGTWARKVDPETRSWRTTKGKAEVTFMKPGDKLVLLRGIQMAGYGREEKIAFRNIGDEAFNTSFTGKAKKLSLKFIRRDIPGQEHMTLQEVVAQAIEAIETEFPDRLTERYNPEADGETYPTRKKQGKPTSGRKVTVSDDEESSDDTTSEDNEDDHEPRKLRLRDRMKRNDEANGETNEVKKTGSTRSKNAPTEMKEINAKEINADHDDDVGMSEDQAEEDSQSRSKSSSRDVHPEIEESDEGEPSYHLVRQTFEQIGNVEEGEDGNNDTMSMNLGAFHNHLSNEDYENADLFKNEEVNGSDIEAGDKSNGGEDEEDIAPTERYVSTADTRGREVRLGRSESNLGDVEISSDDSDEDIPAIRPVSSSSTTKTTTTGVKTRNMARRSQT